MKTIIIKRNTLLVFLICNFVYSIIFAQENINFYTIKSNLDTHYDSLIKVNGIDSMQGTGYNPYKRWADYWEPILYPSGDFAIERQKLEQYVSDFVNGNAPQSVAPFILDWKLIGPNQMPDGSKEWAKGLGQIHYIAFDPNDPTNQKMFACSPAGGLWRSLDGGGTWFNAGTDKGLPLCGVSSIAIDPDNSETNWFVSTGNGEPLPGRFWAQNAVGVGRTTDGGVNWQIIGLENAWQMRKIILTRYQNKVHLFVATTGGLYECEDGLASDPQFSELIDGNFYDIEFDPQNTGIAYASGTGSNTSIYKIDWINDVYTELPTLSSIPVEEGRRLIIEISPAAPQYLFIAATYWNNDNYSFLYRYNLNDNTITYKGEFDTDDTQPGIGPERAMGWTISPSLNSYGDLTIVYGNTAPVIQADNLLDNNVCPWFDVTSAYHNCEIHVDMHYMVFEPDGQTLWVGNDGGVFKSTMPDLINNWEEKNNGLAVATIHHLAVSEDNKDIALSGAFDCGSNLYTRNNNEWNEKQVASDDGFQCQFDWGNPDRMWASTPYSVYRSDNGGQNFYWEGGDLHWHTFFIQNNVYPEILYGTNRYGIRRSADYGSSWHNYANYPGVSNNKTWRVTNSITHGDYIYASWFGNSQGTPQKVFKTVTGGGTNTNDWEDVGSPFVNNWISSIAVDYFDPDHIWVAAHSKVYDVNTITHQWVDISNGLPSYIYVGHLEILPGVNGTLYAGTNYGLYYYTEQEGVWQYVDGNLPNVNISDIQIDMTNSRIVVGTFGRGVWEADLPGITSNDTTYITSSQSCLPEGITFNTQEQIDNFLTNYPDCTEIEGDVIISGSITNLDGLNILTAFGGNLWIGDNPALTSLTGLDNVTSIGGYLWIRNNNVLANLTGLGNVTSFGGDLWIGSNAALTSLTGLDNMTSIGGNLRIGYNDTLTSLAGLGNVTSIGGYLYIYENYNLTSLTGLESLISIGGDFEIWNNDALINLTGLENVTSIGGDLRIGYNSALTGLTGLENVTSIGRRLVIVNNYAMNSLTGLEGLTSIGGYLWITNNDALTSLTGLDSIDASSIDALYIFTNSYLSTCEVQSVCEYLISPTGIIEIYNNAPGCNNQEEVKEACELSVENVNPENEISIFPNPANKQLTITSKDGTTIEEIIIYNFTGEIVLLGKPVNNIIDISELQSGLYIIEVVTGEGTIRKKLMIVK